MAATRATTPARDVFLDAVRAVAVVRVVTWHTYGWAPITWVVAAVPAMFFVSGHLLARSFARRSPRVVVIDRLRRLLVPFWCFGLAAWAAMAVARALEGTPETALPWRSVVWWVVPFNDPHGSVWEGGWLSQPLWYVRCLFWLLLLAPVLHAAARRAPRTVLTVLVGATIVLELAYRHGTWREQWTPDLLWRAGDLTLYAVFLVLGFAHAHAEARGTVVAPRAAALLAVLAVPAAVVVARVAAPQDDVVNNSHVLHLVVGGGWLALALAARGAIGAFAARPVPHAAVAAIGRRSLSIYLWHSSMVITTWHLIVPFAPLPTGLHSALLGVGTVLGTLAVVTLVGPIEDLAARRRPRARPAGAPVTRVAQRGLAVAVLGCTALVLVPPASNGDEPVLAAPGGAAATGSPGSTASAGSPASASAVPGSTARAATPAAPRVPSRAPSVKLAEASPSGSAAAAAAAGDAGDGEEAAPVAETPEPADGDLDRVVSRWQDRWSSSGLVVGVAKPGVWSWTGAPYGGGGDTSFDIESITKTVTASAVWLLASQGRLSVDGPVPALEALPELAGRGITVRNLLEHTSGIPDYHDLETPEDIGEDPAVTVVRNALAAEPEFAPGGGHDYSSTNYLVLGLVIEAVTGRALDDVLWSSVLEPAGVGDRFSRAGASTYLPGGGAGGLVTDAAGLLAWGTAFLRDHRPVGASIWAGMTRFDPGTGLGAGTMGMCPCTSGFLWVGHTGGTTALFYDARDDLVVAVRIANGIWGGFEDAFAELMEELRTNALVK